MSVILANCTLAVRRRTHSFTRDARGAPVAPATAVTLVGSWPGYAQELAGQSNVWSLRVDPAAWPVEVGDEVSDGTRTWVVTEARLHAVTGFPDVDYVAVSAVLEPPKVP